MATEAKSFLENIGVPGIDSYRLAAFEEMFEIKRSRPHSVIMVSPNDASLGKIFDKETYQNGLLAARKTRIQENSSCNRCGL